jgi:hypothetical protein
MYTMLNGHALRLRRELSRTLAEGLFGVTESTNQHNQLIN